MSNNLRQQMIESWTYPPLKEACLGVDEIKGPGWYGGRIKTLSPLVLHWGAKEVQIQADRAKFHPMLLGETMDIGDLVRVEILAGEPLRATSIELLAPAQFPAFQFHQLSQKWSHFRGLIRRFFRDREFTEILTPGLVECPGTEPYLEPFSVEVKYSGKIQRKFLPTSPEINLKKYLARGHTRIFEMKECFRNNEKTSAHRTQFLMLEWYRAFSNLDAILEDLKSLLQYLSEQLERELVKIRVLTVRELFLEFTSFDLRPDSDREELVSLCQRMGIDANSNDTWDELFFRIFIEKIEPNLRPGPIIVRDYPPKLAAYSRLQSSGWADRFELYWKGFEIANAFHELNDPNLQRQRMIEDNERKKALGLSEVPFDEEFLNSLCSGLPPSGGIALGMERLFMAFYDLKDISEVF